MGGVTSVVIANFAQPAFFVAGPVELVDEAQPLEAPLVELALDPTISTMMKDLFMDDKMKGHAAGIFFSDISCCKFPGATWPAIGAQKSSSQFSS